MNTSAHVPVETAPRPPAGRKSPGGRHRILYVEANEDGTVGGSHQVLFNMAMHLDRKHFEPVALFYQDNVFVSRLRSQGVEVHVYDKVRAQERAIRQHGNPAAKLVEYMVTIGRRVQFLRSLRIDLIHINNSPRVGDDDWLPAARLLGRPCMTSVAGDASGAAGGRLRKFLFRSFDWYLPVSSYIYEAMLRAGVPRARMDLLYPGVDLEAFRNRVRRTREDVRRELSIPDDHLFAVMVGNIRQWKGQHVVLAALEQIPAPERRRLHVAFAGATTAGDQEYLQQLQDTVTRAGLAAQVAFLGSRSDVPDLFNAADFALHASVRPEPFGLVVVEALALGKPVIAANTGGPAEIVSPDSGITFHSHEPAALAAILTTLIRNPGQRAALARGARGRAELFSVHAYMRGVEQAYARLLSAR